MSLLTGFRFPFDEDTWSSWDAFCTQGRMAVASGQIDSAVDHAHWELVWYGVPGPEDNVLSADFARESCHNYDQYRAWLLSER